MLFWVPDQNNALRFSGFQPEARLRATLGQDAPYGRGGSAPSPYAPPRQAGKSYPIGHRREGVLIPARVEWAGPVWPKKQVGAGSDMSVVSTLLEVGRIPGEFIRGVEPPLMCAFYLAFCTSKKQAVRPDGTGHSVPRAAHLSKKVRCCTAAQKEPPPGRDRAFGAASGTPLKKSKVLHRCTERTAARGADTPHPVLLAAHLSKR